MAETGVPTRKYSVLRFRQRTGLGRRTVLALFMAFTAVFGGVTAWRAAQAEFTNSSCERRFASAETFELIRRQFYLQLTADHRRWFDRYHEHIAQARRLTTKARSQPAIVKLPRSTVDVAAQLENSLARAAKPLNDFVTPLEIRYAAERDLEPALPARIEQDLREIGLPNRCVLSDAPKSVARDLSKTSRTDDSSYVKQFRADLRALRKRALHESLTLVVFIAVLAFCSLSEINRGRVRRSFQVFAVLLFVGGASFGILEADPWLAVYYPVFALIFLILTTALWIAILKTRFLEGENQEGDKPETIPNEHGMEGEPMEPHEIESPSGTPPIPIPRRLGANTSRTHLRLQRSLVVLLALTALSMGLAGYFANKAERESDYTASIASERETALFKVTTKSALDAFADIHSIVAIRDGRIRRATAGEALRRGGRQPEPISETFWNEQLERTATELDARFWESPLYRRAGNERQKIFGDLDGSLGPYEDGTFPRRYFANRTTAEPARLFAEWDAYDEERAAWERKAAIFLVTLTVCTIGFNLLGQALGMVDAQGLRAATVLGLTGFVVLIASTVSLIVGNALSLAAIHDKVAVPMPCHSDAGERIRERMSAAAECYAYAERLAADLGTTTSDITAAFKAYDAYEKAGELREGFTHSQYRAAQIASTIAAPHKENGYSDLVFRNDVRRIVRAENRVVDELHARGRDPSDGFVAQHYFHAYLYALDADDGSVANRSLEALGRLVERNPNEVLARIHFAMAQLGSGKRFEAERTYDEALELIRGVTNNDQRTAVAAAAISDLELVRENCRAEWVTQYYCERVIPPFAEHMESMVVRAAWQTSLANTKLDFAAWPPSLVLTPNGIGWRTMSPADLRAPGTTVVVAYRYEPDWHSWYVIPSSTYQIPSRLSRKASISNFRSYLIASGYNDCLDMQGRYRLDFYDNGTRIARSELPERLSIQFNGVAFRGPGVSLCYPITKRRWTRWTPHDGSLASGFNAPRLTDGAYAFAFLSERPLRVRAYDLNDPIAIERAVNAVLQRLHRGTLREHAFRASWRACPTAVTPHVEYRSAGLTILAKAWTKADGLVNVGVVWYGTDSTLPVDQAAEITCATLTSMGSVDDAVPVTEEIPASVAARALPATRP
jgi:hypothetical protein